MGRGGSGGLPERGQETMAETKRAVEEKKCCGLADFSSLELINLSSVQFAALCFYLYTVDGFGLIDRKQVGEGKADDRTQTQ